MDIRELRSLMTLAETGSLARTAAQLHLSPAAIHRQLRILGEELGAPLYERRGKELQLSEATRALVPLVRELVTQYETLLAAGKELNGARRGMVRIGTGPTYGSYVLPRLLEEFRGRNPQIELMVDSGHSAQLVEGMQNGRLDLSFLVSPALHPSLVVEKQWKFEVVFVAAASAMPKRISDIPGLRDVPFILYKQGTVFEELIERYLEKNGLRPRVTMRLDNPDLIKAMIRSGFGISMLPAWTVQNDFKTGALRKIRVKAPPLEMSVDLIRRRSDYVSASVRSFLNLCQKWD